METNQNSIKKNHNPMFAFLPEMVIEHINQPEPKEFKISKDNIKELSVNETAPIIFDPLADPFDGLNIEIEPGKKSKKKKTKIKFI